MAPELRAQIFSLKAQDIPITRIAATLGLSEGSVRYQLERRARLIPANGATTIPDAPLAVQPSALQAARESFALEQIEAQRVSLRAQRQEAERRLEMLSKAPGDSSGAILLVMGELREVRQQLDALKNRPVAAPAPAMPVYQQLTELKSGWEAVQTIAGDQKPPTTESELAVKVALTHLEDEREERRRKLDFELEDLRQKRRNDEIRSEAWAEQVRQWGPILMQGAQTWFGQQSPNGAGGEGTPLAGAPVAPNRGAQIVQLPGARAVQPAALGMVEGPCPNCGVALRFRPSPGDDGNCPNCGTALAVVEGRIWPKLAAGARDNARSGINPQALQPVAG